MNTLRITWLRLLRLAFWLFYNPFAWTYDWVSWIVSLGHWRDWQRCALSELVGERVLELASGTGNMLLDLAAAGYRPVGLDLSPTMIGIARRKLRRKLRRNAQYGDDPSTPLVRGYTQRLPFPDACFDSVLSTFPAEFIYSPHTLSEAARVLRPGGRLVVVAMGRLKGRDPWSRFLEWLYRITAQRGHLPDPSPLLEPLGLRYRMVWKTVENTEVLLYVASSDDSPMNKQTPT